MRVNVRRADSDGANVEVSLRENSSGRLDDGMSAVLVALTPFGEPFKRRLSLVLKIPGRATGQQVFDLELDVRDYKETQPDDADAPGS